MSTESWSDIEYVPSFLERSGWHDEIGDLNKEQLLLIAEFLHLELPSDIRKGSLLLQVVEAVKESKQVSSNGIVQDEKLLEGQIGL